MSHPPPCPKCESSPAMEHGWLLDRGHGNYQNPSSWVGGTPEQTFLSGSKIKGKTRLQILAWRCPQCGFLEFYAR